jgi:hypothetical protein
LICGVAFAACASEPVRRDAGPSLAFVLPDGGSTDDAGSDDLDAGVEMPDAGEILPRGDAGSGLHTPDCPAETQFIYTLTGDNSLYRFYPPTLTFDRIGALGCLDLAGPWSMAVDRKGHIFTVYGDGRLFQVSPTTAACTATSFAVDQHGFTTFGMGFSANAAGSSNETLFVSGESGQGLATIDTTSFVLTPVGAYVGLTGTGITGRAELTGTGFGSLYGAFEGMPFVVAQVDKTNAHILSEAPQSGVNNSGQGSNFAFAAWAGGFYIFAGHGTSTNVYLYTPSTSQTTQVTSTSVEVIGAGVSTCAPLE